MLYQGYEILQGIKALLSVSQIYDLWWKMMFDEPLSLMLMQKTDDMSGAGDLRDNMATMSEMNLDDFASTEDVKVTF